MTMKKNYILLIVMLLVAGFANSQNIYYSTYYAVGDDYAARVYKNGEMIFESDERLRLY